MLLQPTRIARTVILAFAALAVFAPTRAQRTTVDDDEDDDESEFAELLFNDTSTDIGGDPSTLEINAVPAVNAVGDDQYFELGFEFEYVLFPRFGLEVEPSFAFARPASDGTRVSGLSDLEIETQFTVLANRRHGLATGLEVQLPIGDETVGLGEGEWELEPFVTYVFQNASGWSVHPRVSLEIPMSGDEPAGEDLDGAEEGVGFKSVVGLLHTFRSELAVGGELIGVAEDGRFDVSVAPQVGYEIGDLFVGTGLRLPTGRDEGEDGWQWLARVIYEIGPE